MKKTILLLTMLCCAGVLTAGAADRNFRIQHFGEDEGFSAALVAHMTQDRRGYIWLATWDGLRRYDGYRFETFKTRPGDNCPLETNRISYVEEDSTGNMVCQSNGKFYRFDVLSRRFERLTPSSSLHSPRPIAYQASEAARQLIASMPEYQGLEVSIQLEDRQGGIWVYSNRGLDRVWMKDLRNEELRRDGPDREEVVSALYTDRHGRLWKADKGGRVRISGQGTADRWLAVDGTLHAAPVSFGYAAYCFFEDSEGTMWMGAKPGGLFRLTPRGNGYRVDRYVPSATDAYSINCDAVYGIAEDSRRRLVIATYGGGMNIGERQADGTMRFVHCGNLLTTFPKTALKCRCVWVGADGTALLGSNDGLCTVSLNESYQKMHFYMNRREPGRATSISNNIVMQVMQSGSGDIWLATSGGGTERVVSDRLLSSDIRFQHFTVDEGISSDMNQALAEDRQGNIWIVSAGSVSLLDPRTGMATNYWRLLDSATDMAFTEATPALLTDGSMALGTTQGVLTLSPQTMRKSDYVPCIVFDCNKEVYLTADERDFSIRFAALDYNKTEQIVYAYKMEGIDSQWRYTRQNELNYVRLAPGTYVLHIKSTNGDGVWVSNEATVTLHRQARFSETPWAWMLYGLLLTVGLLVVWRTVRYIRMLQRELKDVRLTSRQQMEVMGARIKELLPIGENIKEIHEEADDRLSADDRQFAQSLKAYVERNIGNADLTVADMASALNVSRSVLFVRMKQIFNCSPNNYVIATRIGYAKQLLSQPDVRIADVAFRSGFSDPKYFSRCFKKLTGRLPKEYAAES